MASPREIGKRVLPSRAIEWYRRKRALRRYLRSLSYEVFDRQKAFHVEELEGMLIARRPDITEKLMKDLLDRTDLVIQELHRQIEGLRARQGMELRRLTDQVAELRAELERMRASGSSGNGEAAGVAEETEQPADAGAPD